MVGTSDVESIDSLQSSATPGNSAPTIPRISTPFASPKLDKQKANYRQWAQDMKINLKINALGRFIDKSTVPPDASDSSFQHWSICDAIVTAYIMSNVEMAERDVLDEDKSAFQNWELLRLCHEQEGPAKQVAYLQEALSARCKKGTPLPTTAREIREFIRRAFTTEVTEDLLSCICILNSLSGDQYSYICSNIAHSLSQSTTTNPYTFDNILKYLESEQSVLDNLEHKRTAPLSGDPVALAASTNIKRSQIPTCSNCKRTGHGSEWCVSPGGGMAGKTIAKSREARRKAKDKARNISNPSANFASPSPVETQGTPDNCVAFNFIGADGKTFTAYMNPSQPNVNFAGLVTDTTTSIDELEYNGLAAIDQNDPVTSINWDFHTKTENLPIALNAQTTHTPIPIDACPFYLDTGATVHLSPDRHDFTNFTPIDPRTVKGVGESSIKAVGRS